MAVHNKEADEYALFYTPKENTSGREFAGMWRGESWVEAVDRFLSNKPPSASEEVREVWRNAKEKTVVPVETSITPSEEMIEWIEGENEGIIEAEDGGEIIE